MIEKYHTTFFLLHELTIVALGYFAVFVAPVLWFIVLAYRRMLGTKLFGMQILVYLAGWALIFIGGICDPTTFTEWLLD